MKLLDRFEAAFALLLRFCGALGGSLVLLMAIMVTADVAMRNFTGRPITGVFEMSQVALLIATFLVVGYVQYYDAQMKVDIFSSKARGRLRAAVRLFDELLGAFFFGILVWTGREEWLKAWHGDFLKRGLIDYPTTLPLGVLVFGSLLVLLAILVTGIRSVGRLVSGRPDQVPVDPSAADHPLA